jgi:H+-transporting ATPase
MASLLTALIGTGIGLYSFNLMTKISWEWAAFLWAYAAVWFVFNDMVKMVLLHILKKRYNG